MLIVEDEDRMAEALAAGLVAEGFAVDVSKDGVSGLFRAREGSYAAIVLDLLLPQIVALGACRQPSQKTSSSASTRSRTTAS